MKVEIPQIEGFSSEQIDAAAKALREDACSHLILKPWPEMTSSAKKGWWHKAYVALSATNLPIVR